MKSQNNMEWRVYSADHHYGHLNIIRFCDRPFMNVEEMDETLIKNWNDTASVNDEVYILGDLIFHSDKHASCYIKN